MPKLQYFYIEFDRRDVTYAPGEIVYGRVVFSLIGPKIVRDIRLKVRGKAKVHWKEKYGGIGFHTYEKHYRSKEYYFNILTQLVSSNNGDGKITLPAGQHSYSFAFQLPIDIPCSFEHKYGYIRYTMKAILDRPWRFDHEIVSEFAVLAPDNLALRQNFDKPILDEFTKIFFHCCCFDAGVMKIYVSSRTRGFASGETVELKVYYDKSSTEVDITLIKLKLIKYLTFHVSSEKKRKEQILARAYQDGPFRKKGDCLMRFIAPSVPPSNLQHCSIIDVDYRLALTIIVSGMHSSITRFYSVQLWNTVPVR